MNPYEIPSIILARMPEVTERQGHDSLIRGCRTVQRDTAGCILSSVTVSVSDQNRVSRGAVLSLAIVGRCIPRVLPRRVTFLFPRSTYNWIINSQMLILVL